MNQLINTIWKTLRQCVAQNNSEDEIYVAVLPNTGLPRSENRSASPNSVADSVSISVRSSGSECSGNSWRDNEELRKGWNYPRNNSVENPSITSVDSGYDSAAF